MKERIIKIVIIALVISSLSFNIEGNILQIYVLETWRYYVAIFLTGGLFGISIREKIERIIYKKGAEFKSSTEKESKPIKRRRRRREIARRKRVNKE